MHSNTALRRSCSNVSAILFRMWNNDCVKEGGRGKAFYSQRPCLIFRPSEVAASYLTNDTGSFPGQEPAYNVIAC